MKRSELLKSLRSDEVWDIIVIGGGATGLGAALEAATRGYKTLLLEQYDYTIGTSSRSTKLVHGGVRYLAQGDIRLVLEALKERGLLLRNAPHLVKNQSFLIPSYNWWNKPFYTIGLSLYDFLAGKLSFGWSLPYSKNKTIKKIPNLITKNLRGGVLYHDGQFDDARLGINLVQTIMENGGTALNYVAVRDFLKENDKISGVVAMEGETGEEFKIKAKVVLNATGVFTDTIMQIDNPEAEHIVKPSQGVHIVIDKEFLQSDFALMIPKTVDGRVLFAVPWHNRIILGTTDIPKDEASIEPVVTDAEIDFILETVGRYLKKTPTKADIKSVFAGLRPLAAPKNENGKTKEISRKHKIFTSKSGLVSIIGGKWTTYREMGEDAVDKLSIVAKLPSRKSVTENLHIHGYKTDVSYQDPLYTYGSDKEEIEKLISETPLLGEVLSEELKVNKAQIVWAVRKEFARNVDDVLSRRIRALILDAKESVRIAPKVAKIMAEELGHDENWEKDQIQKFNTLAKSYIY
ncbi:MAG: glycerol-3-phosphate dehydrogenase/oxidase [Bacteroidales bacterium]|nr:glycerol-3-phosphate dehydrogenase/oxidase [Bacteroidales bacterium]MCF8391685.1 glycerol-3-phosphate dehydrogenase/oxidase [Bacteroidales bacterium]